MRLDARKLGSRGIHYARNVVIFNGAKACILKLPTSLSRLYLQWHSFSKSGEHPAPGGLLCQPLKFVHAMNVLSAVEEDIRKARDERPR